MKSSLHIAMIGTAVLALTATAHAQTAAKCAAKKTQAAGAHLKAILVCQAKGASNPRFDQQKCFQRANDNLVDAFATAEAKGGCVTTGDDDSILILNGDTFDDVVGKLPYSDACAATKLKASGRYANAALSCTVKAIKVGTAASNDCLDRATATLETSFARADSSGECATAGNLDAILAAVDAGVDDVTDTLPPILPTPTATATASATYTYTIPPTDTPVPPTNTPTSIPPTNTPATPTGPCNGTQVGGFCWYLGSPNQTCDTVCAAHASTCNINGTSGYAGAGGTAANCNAVLDAMNLATAPNASTMHEGYAGYGGGCSVNYGINQRIHWNGYTACDARDSLNANVCACDPSSQPTNTATPIPPTNTPTPVPPTNTPGAATCSGTQVGGYCWYLGNLNQTCDTVCAAHASTCNINGTSGYAGAGGTAANCNAVLDAMNLGTAPNASTMHEGYAGYGGGCSVNYGINQRIHWNGYTACDARDSVNANVCACDPSSQPTNTPTPTPVPPTATPGCGGAQVGGFCWYLGGQGQSCDAVCSARGSTCNLAGTDYAGGGGTAAECNAVLDALHLGTVPASTMVEGGSSPHGCSVDYGFFQRVHFSGMTSCAASDALMGRACACGTL